MLPAAHTWASSNCSWVCARRSLWRAEEQQPEVCSTRGVALYSRPSAQAVAAQALADM